MEPEGRVPGQAAALEVQPHRNTLRRHIFLHLANAESSKVKDAGRQHGIGLALDHALGKMLERAHAAACDHRDRHRARHGAGECQVEASLGAVAIHAGEQDLTGAATSRFLGPRHRIDTRGVAPAVKTSHLSASG